MSVKKTAVTCASAACLALAVPSVKAYEGYWPTVKVDTIGTGRPCTGGYGETEGVKCGETHNEKYWADKLQMRLQGEYDTQIGKCIHVDLPDSARAAALSASYNAGTAAVCRSPMVAKWNAGDVRGGCEALAGWYIRAQGHVVQGLINRRAKERRLCLSGLSTENNKSVDSRAVNRPVAPAPVISPKPVAPKPACSWWRKCA